MTLQRFTGLLLIIGPIMPFLMFPIWPSGGDSTTEAIEALGENTALSTVVFTVAHLGFAGFITGYFLLTKQLQNGVAGGAATVANAMMILTAPIIVIQYGLRLATISSISDPEISEPVIVETLLVVGRTAGDASGLFAGFAMLLTAYVLRQRNVNAVLTTVLAIAGIGFIVDTFISGNSDLVDTIGLMTWLWFSLSTIAVGVFAFRNKLTI